MSYSWGDFGIGTDQIRVDSSDINEFSRAIKADNQNQEERIREKINKLIPAPTGGPTDGPTGPTRPTGPINSPALKSRINNFRDEIAELEKRNDKMIILIFFLFIIIIIQYSNSSKMQMMLITKYHTPNELKNASTSLPPSFALPP